MKTEKDIFIGEVKNHLSDATPPRPKHRGRLARMIGAGGTIGIAWKLIAVAVVVGSLIGIAFQFNILQITSIQTEGVYTPQMYFDGVVMDSAEYTAPSDVFSDGVLAAGETESFPHTLMSPVTDGDWDVYWTVGEFMDWFTTPTDPSYGYNFSITNDIGATITYMTVMHGDTKTINFVHYLNSHYDQENAPVDGIPFKLDLHVYPYTPPPVASDDTYTIPYQVATIIHPLENDAPLPLIITGVNGVPTGSTATIDPTGQFITYYHISLDPETFSYTISTVGTPIIKTDVGSITVNIVNQAPIGGDDTTNLGYNTPTELNVLANDVDPEGVPLHIVAVDTSTPITATITGAFPNQKITLFCSSGSSLGLVNIWYDISDGVNTVRVMMHITYS